MSDVTPDYRRRVEDRAARERGDFVGFLACSHGRGRLLKVALPDRRERVRAACPVEGCPDGEHETANAMTRARRRGETCDVAALPAQTGGSSAAPDDPTALHGRQSVTDAAILEAVPVGRDVVAADAARQAGYEGDNPTNSFTRRLQRWNARAEKAGEAPPFIVTPGGPGKPATVRQSEREEVAA